MADVFLSVICSTAALLAINVLGFGLPWELILLVGIFAFAVFAVARYRSRLTTGMLRRWRRGRGKESLDAQTRLLIVGTGGLGQFCARQVQYRLEGHHCQIVGFVANDLYKRGMRIQGVEVLGSLRSLPSLIVDHDIDLVVVAAPDLVHDGLEAMLESCQHLPVQIKVVPDVLAFVYRPGQDTPDDAGDPHAPNVA